MHLARAGNRREFATSLGVLGAVLIAIKAVMLLVDPQVRFFLGDSATYLWSAASGSAPPDRSFTYPLLIRHIALPFGSLLPLLVAQSAFGILSALIAFHLLAASFRLDLRIAGLLAVVVAIGPEQLFFERMVMAESEGLLAFVLMLGCGFAYLRDRRWTRLVGIALAGIIAVSFRMSLLPVVLGFAPLAPAIAWLTDPKRGRGEIAKKASALLLVIAATAAAHVAYQHWYGRRAQVPPDYIAHGGYFRLGLVAPLVLPQDLRGLGLPDTFLDDVSPPVSDLRGRESQLWLPSGLVAHLRAALGDREGNRAAAKMARRALERDPLGLLRMGASTLIDYFDANVTAARMWDDQGQRAPSPQFAADIERWYHISDATGMASQATPVFRYFGASSGWLTACLFGLVPLSLLMLACAWRSHARAAALLLAATSIGAFAGHALFSHIVSYRYLHAFPLLAWLNVGALVALVGPTRLRRQASGRASPVDPVPRRREVDHQSRQ